LAAGLAFHHELTQELRKASVEGAALPLLVVLCVAGIFGYAWRVGAVVAGRQTPGVVPDRVRQALDTLAEGLLVLDEEGRIVLANQAFASTVGIDSGKLLGARASDLPWTIDHDHAHHGFPWAHAIDKAATVTEQMLHLQVSPTSYKIFSVNASPIGGGQARRGALATFRDVTHIEQHRVELERMLSMLRDSRDEIERKNRELEVLATQDALTGCLNRRAFFERFARLWKEAKQRRTPIACLMIDNDHFKSVNDAYGHAVGDEVLRRIAHALRDQFQKRGLVCRYGGEEFCVVLPQVPYESAIDLAEQARQAVEQIRFERPAGLRLTASIGVSETCFGACDPQELINQADACLYAAKHEGRNRVIPYSDEVAAVEVGERCAHGRDPFTLSYQVVDALLATLAYRDAPTACHCRRVAELCSRVAAESMPPRERDLVETAALLHEIGKIAVPDDLWQHAEPCGERSPRFRPEHEQLGIGMVEAAFGCPELTEILRHRETPFDHGGQSCRAATVETTAPDGARLLAVCDQYDLLVSGSAGRAASCHRAAIETLRQQAGTRFDPVWVEIFAGIVQARPEESAFELTGETARGLALQVEQLVAAIEDQHAAAIGQATTRLIRYAHQCDAPDIAASAERILHQAEADDVPWFDLLQETHGLLQQCQAAQADLVSNGERGAELAAVGEIVAAVPN
jgi:diguanylate cyclase (GGDEF)-like protein/PAS domain S-box-containing protein